MIQRTEAELQTKVRTALGAVPDLCLWRNNVGSPDGVHHYGLPKGSADLVGILAMPMVDGRTCGRFIALELKSPTGRVSPEQVTWLACVRRFGGFAAVIRSVPEALEAIARARAGASE